jgi:hypothetical protein
VADRNFGVGYWEVGNEVDIGEDGGCPYRFKPEDYLVYYTRTAKAILAADPRAKVGGPALAGYRSRLGDALIEHCGRGEAPLHFLSWHLYDNDPARFRRSIREMKEKLAKFPRLEGVETVIDEWNMSLGQPILDPRFQPAFVLETTLGFLEEGLSRSAYYHIRDAYVDEETFSRFMSPQGVSFMAHWWNVRPQYDGLYDHEGRARPAWHSFKLLSLIRGRRLPIGGTDAAVRGLAAEDGRWIEILFWHFPAGEKGGSVEVRLRLVLEKPSRFRLSRLNAGAPLDRIEVLREGSTQELEGLGSVLGPYEIRWLEVGP